MDKLIPQSTNSTSATHSNSNSNWDLGMDADYHRHCHNQHQTLHDHQLFHFSSIPTWPNYSPLPAQSPLMVQEPRTMKHTETLVEEDVIRSGELKEELLVIEEEDEVEEEEEELGAMKEMMYKIAAMQPVEIDPATIRKPKRRNVRISDDPQSVAARLRRERISEKIRILQRLVPGGTKLDTASMLDEAVRYVKFLKRQIRQLQHSTPAAASTGAPVGGGELPLCFSFNQP